MLLSCVVRTRSTANVFTETSAVRENNYVDCTFDRFHTHDAQELKLKLGTAVHRDDRCNKAAEA
jgi:hypothetical protein